MTVEQLEQTVIAFLDALILARVDVNPDGNLQPDWTALTTELEKLRAGFPSAPPVTTEEDDVV